LAGELDRLRNELTASEAWHLHVSLRKLDQSFRAFQDSNQKLASALVGVQDPRVIMEVFDEAHRDRVDKLVMHFGTLLQNYVASAFSLGDTTRTFAKRTYSSSSFWPEYADHIRTSFAEAAAPHFVRELKNHTQHEAAVLLTAGLHISDIDSSGKGSARTTIALNLARLREEVSWTDHAKGYLDGKGNELDLVTLLDDYSPVVFDFHTWLRQRQADLHAGQFREIEQREDEIRAVETHLAAL